MSGNNETQHEILTMPETAEYLNIPITTLYKRYKSLKIPHVKIGKQIRFPKELLRKWILDGCKIK